VTRVRAGLDPLPTTVTSEEDLITEVLKERRLEFAMEGHRFFDLRRTGRAEATLGIQPFRLLWPIPLQEIEVNSLLDQNPGY
jgi:starch-binding outer membrane protein, SusD/RagB family